MRPTQPSITMLVLWNISLETVLKLEDGNLAIKILCFMAYMSPTRIPLDLLFALFQNSTTEDSFENAVEILEDYSLIASLSSDDSDSRSFSIHRMIQDSTIENLKARTNEGLTSHAIFNKDTLLNETEVLLKLSDESVGYLNAFRLSGIPHIEELVESLVQIANHISDKLDVEEFRYLTKRTADVLRMKNNFSNSIQLFERALKATPSVDEIEITKKIALTKGLALAYSQGGQFQKSLDFYLEVLEVQIRTLGPDHEDTLSTKNAVACVLNVLGRFDEATLMYREVLQGYENNGDTQSLEFQMTKTGSAFLLITKEENKEDLVLSTQLLKELEQSTGFNCDNIIFTKVNIALKLMLEGHLEEASKMLLQNIEDATKLFGPFHMVTLQCQQAHALVLHDQEKYELAAPLLLELLETEETQLGSDHPSTLATKRILGSVYLATKELDKAAALLDVEVRERVYGPDNLETLKAATVLSDVKEEQGMLKDALALRQKVLSINKNVYGPNDKDTLATMRKISVLYATMDEYEQAAKVVQSVLEHQEEALGKTHPDAIETLNILTLCRKVLDEQNDLIRCFMMWTLVEAEIGKFLLKASNWNLEVALDNYRISNPWAHFVDPNQASTPGSETLTDAQIKSNLIVDFMAVTGVNANVETGKYFLQASDWNLESALEAFFESNPNEDTADLNLQAEALIPSAAAADAENQNVSAASCDETVVNPVQDLGVEVVRKPIRTSTSILFRFPGGSRLQGEFNVSSTVKDLYEFVIQKRPDLADSNYVLALHPNTELTEMEETMKEANLLNNVALTLKMLKK